MLGWAGSTMLASTRRVEDVVQNFIENPYFLRPQFLPSGRVTPEVSRGWKTEDFINDTKDNGKWWSVENRISRRKQEGRERRKLLGRHPVIEEEVSHLTVSCE
jgi:hypothetical protein